MALFIPTFSEFNLFEPTLRPRVRRLDPLACHVVPKRPRCRPFHPVAHFMAPWNIFEEEDMLNIKNKKESFEASLDLSGFDAKNLKVHLNPKTRMLTVSGEREERSAQGSLISSKHFQRSFRLPKDCSVDQITSSFSRGKLAIVAPKQQAQIENKTKEAPAVTNQEASNKPTEPVAVPVEVHQTAKEDTSDPMDVEKTAPKPVEIVLEDSAKENSSTDANQPGAEVAENEITTTADSANYEFTINMKGFDPEHMEVVVDDSGFVQVSAKKKEELEDGSISTQEIKKRVAVDATKYDLDEISSHLNDDGIMTISVPEKVATPSTRQITINRTN